MNFARPIAIAVVQQNGHFLVGQRAKDASLGGYAEFPGGKVQAGESPSEAAVRECLEETGILVDVLDLLGEKLHRYQHDDIHLYFYSCRPTQAANSPEPPFRWVSRSELGKLEFPEANRSLLDQLK